MDVESDGVKAAVGHDGDERSVVGGERDRVEVVTEHFALRVCESEHEVRMRASLKKHLPRDYEKQGEVEMTG